MTAISIRRWASRYRAARPQPAERVTAWNAALTRLEPGALDGLVRDDEWVCVRRLPIALRIREHDGDVQAAHAWSESLAERLARELRDGTPDNVVRYRGRRDAIADFAYRAAVGDLRRTWAWRQMGLLPTDEPAASRASMLARALQALACEPASIAPTLARLAAAERECGAWTAFAGALDAEQWHGLLAASPRTCAYEAVGAYDAEQAHESQDPRTPFAQALLAWAAAHAHLARRIERVIAVLLAAEAHSGLPALGAARDRLAAATMKVRAATGATRSALTSGRASTRTERSSNPSPPDADAPACTVLEMAKDFTRSPRGGDSPLAPIAPAESDIAASPEAPSLPEAVETFATDWGGLLFLLNVLPEVDFIEPCAARLPVMLRHLAAAHLAVPPDEPAVRAFCGGAWPRIEETTPAEEQLAVRAAADLRALLERRLDLDAGIDPVAYVCRRRGELRFESGWIELAMEAGAADVRLRRAALDLDPGFVPWLGCVVRFRYE
jgi:hypothetical protein